ncbi:MAG TPA: alpha/beta hydrolase [Pseudonocardia sp.]|jgi:pimeloyl-ACP methyl ester carboxylesterase
MKRLVIATVLICLVLAGCAGPKRAPLTAGSGPETSYTPPPIAWSKCTDKLKAYNADCGFLVVPLDYSQPAGMKIKIAVSRINHTVDAGDYQGVVFVNLTSPGVSSVGQPAFSKLFPDSMTGDYDFIGFDTRGVGASQPALRCGPTLHGYNHPAYIPATAQEQAAWLQTMKDHADDCAKTNSPLLKHVTTLDNVQDMDSLRKALGQGQISLYGYWYGAYLGEVYSTMYPGRVRRMVFDSSIDPSQVWFGFNFAQNAPLDQNIAVFCAWVAQHDNLYHLGTNGAAVEQQYAATLDKLKKAPASGLLGPTVLTDTMLLAYYTKEWEDLARAFSALVNKADIAPMKSLYDENYPTTNDNAYAMQQATECTDAPWPRDWNTWLSATTKSYQSAPLTTWNNMWFVASCQFWSVPAQQAAPVVDGSKAPPILMVLDSTIEPNTTYAGSLAVRKLFPKAVLVQSGATPAGSNGSDDCSPGKAIVDYLEDGTLPARVAGDTADLKCPANPLPDPANAGR